MVISASDVRRTYGETVALDGVSLDIDAGEIYGLIGPNGAGKTTLVRALTGTTDPEGEVRLLGEDPKRADPQRLGLLPQEFSPPARLTAREVVSYYGGLYDESRDVDETLADVGLTDSGNTYYEDLSGGQKRRVCVATTLVNDPDVLFLDEPTTGIDPQGRRDVWGLIDALADAGATVLVTTHYMEEAERLCDRVGLLAGGRLVAEGPPADLVAEHGGRPRVEIRADDPDHAREVLAAAEYAFVPDERRLVVDDVAPDEVGDVATTLTDAGVAYDGLLWRQPDLEEVYLQLTGQTVGASGTPREVGDE
ncbi:ABC transporter ATP-binding protein [Halosegnis longus]|uniref:ABC transporter ATP-binding protein n=1 Tax=Halosegnis longus TaxID=2216012 RepID=A0AAJ4UW94_9EURY|nr:MULTISPECIES: ABC transporter ATP-binding protein [Halobacteriales]RNJ26841.1 ABC transporter ATP-binding protein [Salella cibi]